MTEQKKRIIESSNFIKVNSPFKGKFETALITYANPAFLKEFNAVKTVPYKTIPPKLEGAPELNAGEIIYAESGQQKILILNGHINFYSGFKMRDAAHPIYVLKELGIKNLIIVDEVGYLNPKFEAGGLALIYDHINFMGDNPLIGENDSTIGPRFPDMSDPYDSKLYSKIERFLIDKKIKFFPSVYIGVTGPETETEAECRFYREIGSDVLGYSLVPENIAAVHCGLNCAAFGIISRELVADRLVEISEGDKMKNRLKAEKLLAPMIKDVVSQM
jgi:purine-nucleoside phosphorylase